MFHHSPPKSKSDSSTSSTSSPRLLLPHKLDKVDSYNNIPIKSFKRNKGYLVPRLYACPNRIWEIHTIQI